MKNYIIAGKEYAVIGQDLYEKLPELTIVTDPDEDALPGTDPAPQPKTATKQIRKYVPTKGYKRGVCGNCGKDGHNAWKCPDRKKRAGAPTKKEKGVRTCGTCGKTGHTSPTCPDRNKEQTTEDTPEQPGRFIGTMDELKARVKEIRAEHQGINSLRVAQLLGVRMETLNKVWENDPVSEWDAVPAEEEH